MLVALNPFYYALNSGEGAGGDGYALAYVVVDIFAGLKIEDFFGWGLGQLHEIGHGSIVHGHNLMDGVVGGVAHHVPQRDIAAVKLLHPVYDFFGGTYEYQVGHGGNKLTTPLTATFHEVVFHW